MVTRTDTPLMVAEDWFYRDMFRRATVGLLVTTPTAVVLTANDAFARMLGMSLPDVVGMSAVALTHPDDREEMSRRVAEMATGDVAHLEWDKRYLRSDGSAVWARVNVHATYAPDGTLSHHLVSARDLSLTRELLQQLDEANLRFRRLSESNLLGIAVAEGTRVLEANDEYLRQTGITREEFEHRGIDWEAITPTEELAADEVAVRQIIERGVSDLYEKSYVRPDGTRVPILLGCAQLSREPLRWIGFTIDQTRSKTAEAERDRLLEEARAARHVAESALRARDTALGKVTHDLRAPVAANLGYAAMMQEGLPVPLPPPHQQYVERMASNQRHMLALLDELLEFARHASGRRAFELQALDVSDLQSGLAAMVEPQARTAGVSYVWLPTAGRLVLRADRTAAVQVLANVVGNAIKFTPPGGSITVAASAAEDVVRVAVSDTGPGIPAEELERIFEPFVQSAPTANDRASVTLRGFGLGLSISRELARGMGGDLTVRSALGEGSTFTFTAPRG